MYSLHAGSGLFLLAVLAGLQVRLSPSGLPPDAPAVCFFSQGCLLTLGARANRSLPSWHFERRADNRGGVLHPRWVQSGLVIVLVTPFASLANLAALCWGGASYAQLNKPFNYAGVRTRSPVDFVWASFGDGVSYCLEVGQIQADINPVSTRFY